MPDSTRPTERPKASPPSRPGLNLEEYAGPKHSKREARSERTVAIVGASNDRHKFGNKAVRAYKEDGYTVWPVNPHEDSVEGLHAYPDVAHLPGVPFLTALYVHEDAAIDELDQLSELDRDRGNEPAVVYLPPGADNPNVVRRAEALGMFVEEACPIVAIGKSPDDFPDE